MTHPTPPAASPPCRPRQTRPPLPPPRWSGRLLVRLAPSRVGMFRFLLEAYENLAAFTVLDKHAALLKLSFSPHRERAVRAALKDMAASLPLEVREWPTGEREGEYGEKKIC